MGNSKAMNHIGETFGGMYPLVHLSLGLHDLRQELKVVGLGVYLHDEGERP
jgi:hypothetical protein